MLSICSGKGNELLGDIANWPIKPPLLVEQNIREDDSTCQKARENSSDDKDAKDSETDHLLPF